MLLGASSSGFTTVHPLFCGLSIANAFVTGISERLTEETFSELRAHAGGRLAKLGVAGALATARSIAAFRTTGS